MDAFSEPTRRWFNQNFERPTRVQNEGWPVIARGENALLLAPTGSGKTLAAFLWAIDRVSRLAPDAPEGARILYVSPLKALVYDVERNLRAPLAGIQNAAARGGDPIRNIQVDLRTGDTSSRDRRRQLSHPADILVTTPESLFLLLGSRARETLKTVHTVIVDEIHALAPSKRGVHLALSLERLSALTDVAPQRIGLSATVRPPDTVARFLGGSERPVEVVDASEPSKISLRVTVPVADMVNPLPPPKVEEEEQDLEEDDFEGSVLRPPQYSGSSPPAGERGIWAVVVPQLLEAIRSHQSTIIFVNSRGLCERLSQQINDLAGEPLVRAHHGSVSHAKRAEMEEGLKAGTLTGIVATSSLELGIDMGAVDLVVLVESPGSVARGLQRVGRAGHAVGQVSEGLIFPKHRGDLLEASVVAGRMLEGAIEAVDVPEMALDVLAQQIVGWCVTGDRTVDAISRMARGAYCYRNLSQQALMEVLDMLTGRYPSDEFADLRPRLSWDRAKDVVSARRGTRLVSVFNAGTIPDRGLFGVHMVGEGGEPGRRIGELDEEMVHETREGDTFLLGASSWRVERITRDRVLVSPAPGQPGRMPFWHGSGPGRPLELGKSLGAFVREMDSLGPQGAREHLSHQGLLNEHAIDNLVSYLEEQKEHTGTLPTDRTITVERFRDELGDWRVCILTPFGARVHAPWAHALEAMLSAGAGFEVQTMYTDDGIVVHFADSDEIPGAAELIPDPAEVEDLVTNQLNNAALFASTFRENAVRSLLLPRKRPGQRSPLWQQRLKARNLLAVVRNFPSFPILLETYRQCMRDVFDLPALIEVLGAIEKRHIRIVDVETSSASPFARSLVFSYVASYIYEQDAPLAERRAQALTLDRTLLRELLGQDELRELLDADVVQDVETELQGLADGWRARNADEVHDLLRRTGDLSDDELRLRAEDDPAPWLETLRDAHRAVQVSVAGQSRWVAAEDAARYRDALGRALPPGLPHALLATVERPVRALARRYARSHGPFVTEQLGTRYDMSPAQLQEVLLGLESDGVLVHGAIAPKGTRTEWCDAEILRRLKRRTLGKLRADVAPVQAAALATFVPQWQGVGARKGGEQRLLEVVRQLQGAALPWSTLSREILPARVADFSVEMLDALSAGGEILWLGRGALGSQDGRIVLFQRETAPLLALPPEEYVAPTPLHEAILGHLEERGASFVTNLRDLDPKADSTELEGTLWDLVWAGLVTNDTFAPLRGLGARKRMRRGRGVGRIAGGRWALVSELLGEVTDTERAHSFASQLLERYGVVSRETAQAENLPGGFSAVYGVLKAMEESGRIRRGHFVEGLTGAQFALPGAVERLRDARKSLDASEASESEEVRMLSATDPANVFGSLLPWPTTGGDGTKRPRRVPGAWVLSLRGEPVLYVEPKLRGLITFAQTTTPQNFSVALRALGDLPNKKRTLVLERIDGGRAEDSAFAEVLMQEGYVRDYRGMMKVS